MVNAYVKKAMNIEKEFKRIFNTSESLILQYHDCFKYKFVIDGVDVADEKWLDRLQTLYFKLDDVIRTLSDQLGVGKDLAYEILVKSM